MARMSRSLLDEPASVSLAWRVSCVASLVLLMSMRQPVSLAARRAFCPSLPIASDNWSSGTITVAVLLSRVSSRIACLTRAGLSALLIKTLVSALHSTTSIFSPPSSLTIDWMRMPRMPTQEPTGSTPS